MSIKTNIFFLCSVQLLQMICGVNVCALALVVEICPFVCFFALSVTIGVCCFVYINYFD